METQREAPGDQFYRKSLLSTLLRIQTDLMLYLNHNPSKHDIWWITHQTYEMICSFFKNLCEGNNSSSSYTSETNHQ
jgi:hypothetical protein